MTPKIDPWVREILVDPFGKLPLEQIEGGFRSSYGRVYRTVDGVIDLRRPAFHIGADERIWASGQRHYEQWSTGLARADSLDVYRREIASVRQIYEQIPLLGRVLDVGGHQGRLREYLADDQQYLSCDPYASVFADIEKQPNLLRAYRALNRPCNFVACHAEHLPIAEQTFDVVHMRSVIDHFRDPALALIEAFRVLRPAGQLVVGLTVEGGKSGQAAFSDRIKEAVRHLLPYIGVQRYSDHHVWHPTYRELAHLIEASGFRIEKAVWQEGTADRVVYIAARKA